MGTGSKLLAAVDGKPVVRHAAEHLLAAGVDPLVVVLGAAAAGVREALAGLPVRFVGNPGHASGMASSVAAGVAALDLRADAVVLALGDMPAVRAATVRRLLTAFRDDSRQIAVPTHRGARGHPVVIGLGAYRTALLGLRGDAGARSILAAHAADILSVEVSDPGVRIDVDTPADLADLRRSGVPAGGDGDRPSGTGVIGGQGGKR
jgi:molybdenum cofactor cytidylyltransferase